MSKKMDEYTATGKLILIETKTGAVDGFYNDLEYTKTVKKRREKRFKGSEWVISQLTDDSDSEKLWHIFYDSINELRLISIYGDNDAIKKKAADDSVAISFNFYTTAFDVLTDYAFGGDKQAALEYLKAL